MESENKEYIVNDIYTIKYVDVEQLKCIADVVVDEILSYVYGLSIEDLIDTLENDYNRNISNEYTFNHSYLITDGENEYYIELVDDSDMETLMDELLEIYLDENEDLSELMDNIQSEGYIVIINNENSGLDESKLQEDWDNSNRTDLTANIKGITPRTENKEVKTEGKLNKDDIVRGYEEYLKKRNEEADEINFSDYMSDIFYDVEDENDINAMNEAEEELLKKYNLTGDISACIEYDNDYNDNLYESEQSDDMHEEQALFSGIEFEEKIPHTMRFKQWDIIKDDENIDSLYWITQQFFGKEELNQFVKAFKELGMYKKAYVTVRDLSSYVFSTDKAKNILVKIELDTGTKLPYVDDTGYREKIKEIGYDFDYETGKWDDTEVVS